MAPPARPPHIPDPDQDPDAQTLDRTVLDAALRLVEGVDFCCLSALVIFWFADRLRSVDFDPFNITPCQGVACEVLDGPYADSPWSIFTNRLEPRGLTTFSRVNLCAGLGDLIAVYGVQGEGTGVELIADLMVSLGTLRVTPAGDALRIAPGPRNDSLDDVLRDALRWQPTRGCHPMNYTPVFWPLFLAWTLLINLRFYRKREYLGAR